MYIYIYITMSLSLKLYSQIMWKAYIAQKRKCRSVTKEWSRNPESGTGWRGRRIRIILGIFICCFCRKYYVSGTGRTHIRITHEYVRRYTFRLTRYYFFKPTWQPKGRDRSGGRGWAVREVIGCSLRLYGIIGTVVRRAHRFIAPTELSGRDSGIKTFSSHPTSTAEIRVGRHYLGFHPGAESTSSSSQTHHEDIDIFIEHFMSHPETGVHSTLWRESRLVVSKFFL